MRVTPRIRLICTKQTVGAGVYLEKLKTLEQNIDLTSLATPLLVPMIEEGIYQDEVSQQVIARYLNDPLLSNIKSLILGCTHYPIIKSEIKTYFNDQDEDVEIIDSADTVASALKAFLEYHQLVNKERKGEDQLLVSDFTESFESTTKMFFGREVHLEKVPIWDELN